MMVLAFWAEEQLIDWKKQYGSVAAIFLQVPSAVYAAIVWIMNYYYRKLATVLTEWGWSLFVHYFIFMSCYIDKKTYFSVIILQLCPILMNDTANI